MNLTNKTRGRQSPLKEKKMLKLDKTISITVPQFMNDGSAMRTEVFQRMDAITKFFGGVTVTEAKGEWFSDAGIKHVDSNLIYEWNVGDVEDAALSMSHVMLGILGLLNAGEQEAVFFKLGTTAYIYDNSIANLASDEAERAIENYLGGF